MEDLYLFFWIRKNTYGQCEKESYVFQAAHSGVLM